ncbi:MAG: C25 family cysteine peptidase [Promethearchaeota archaeon]
MISKKSIFLVLTLFFVGGLNTNYSPNPVNNIKSISLEHSASVESVDYLIITTSDFESALEPLAIWKTQRGIVSKIELISDINQQYSGKNGAEKIKNCISDYHNICNTQWVLLAGDENFVPTQYALCREGYIYDGDVVCCDSYYTDLDNDWDSNDDYSWGGEGDEYDFEAEVYVGRLSANNENEMKNLVQRILNYENNPPVGPWMSHAIFAGTILQFDIDWNDDNVVDYGECDGNRVNDYIETLFPDNWTSVILAQTEGIKGSDNYSDDQLSYNSLKNNINQGFSIGNVFAHGSPQGMAIDKWTIDYDGDLLFDYTANPWEEGGTPIDVMLRENLIDISFEDIAPEDNKTGLLYFGSCSTGTFDVDYDCLAEKFLKTAAIGVIAASHVAWGEDQWYERDHGGWFIEGLGFRLWEQLLQHNHPGKALALAKADYVSDRNNSTEPNDYPKWEDKTLKQYNLLGDPEVPIWLAIPKQLNISILQPVDDENVITLKVTADGDPVQGVTITYNKHNSLFWKGITNENGTVEVSKSEVNINGKILTASKIGYLPYQETIPPGSTESIPGYVMSITLILLLSFIGISIVSYNRMKLRKKRI